MNCKTCGGSTTPKNTPRGQAFECNQENGDCIQNNGYPTTTWAQSRGQNGGGFQQRRAPQQVARPVMLNVATDGGQAWGNAKNVAAQLMSGAGAGSFDEFLALARKIYAAKPTVAKPKPEPAPEQEEEVQVF